MNHIPFSENNPLNLNAVSCEKSVQEKLLNQYHVIKDTIAESSLTVKGQQASQNEKIKKL